MGTVRGAVAGGWDPNAFNLRVSSEVCRTDALLLVADNVAEGIEPAGSLFAARVSALALVTHLIHLAVAVLCAGSCDRRLDTDEVFADAFADTVPVDTTLFLLAANLLVVGIAKETFGAGTDGLMALGGTLCISATNDRTRANVLAFKQPIFPSNTCVFLTTFLVIGTTRLQDANTA